MKRKKKKKKTKEKKRSDEKKVLHGFDLGAFDAPG